MSALEDTGPEDRRQRLFSMFHVERKEPSRTEGNTNQKKPQSTRRRSHFSLCDSALREFWAIAFGLLAPARSKPFLRNLATLVWVL
jgi:hypothetical protein